jgi:hypothetical protein
VLAGAGEVSPSARGTLHSMSMIRTIRLSLRGQVLQSQHQDARPR